MPLYMCNAVKGTISDEAKEKIANDIVQIHCEVTGAPAQFVHAFFVEDSALPPLDDKKAMLFGNIRAGRNDAQKTQIISRMRQSVQMHTWLELEDVGMITADVPASWTMEGGEIMPEPGEEAEWLAKHAAKPATA